MTASHQPATRPLHHWTFLLLILLSVVVYYPGLSGDYMFDDTSNLLQNQALDMETLDVDSLSDAAWSSGASTGSSTRSARSSGSASRSSSSSARGCS